MYEAKGRINEEQTCHWVVEQAEDIADALKCVTEKGMYEVFALSLSRVKEVFPNAGKRTWYKATVKEERMMEMASEADKKPRPAKVRKVTYQVLVQADDLNDASKFLKSQLEQGYDFEMSGLVETDVDDVL